MRLNLGCGPHYATGWVNVDRVYDETANIRPDIVNPTGRPLLLEVENVERIYLGHVLEHVRWEDVPSFLGECLALLEPGGQIMVVGPDIWNTLRMWRNGSVSDELVDAVLEGPDPQVEGVRVGWDGARHQWNAEQARVVYGLEAAGFQDVTAWASMAQVPDGWPIVARAEWQSAVSAVAP